MTKLPLAFPTIAALALVLVTVAWSCASFKPVAQHQKVLPAASPVIVALEQKTWPQRLEKAKQRGALSTYWTKSTAEQRQSFAQYYVRKMRQNMTISSPQHFQYLTIQAKEPFSYEARKFWARRWWREQQTNTSADGLSNAFDDNALDSAISDANELLFLRVVDVQRYFVCDSYETVYQQVKQMAYFQSEFSIVEGKSEIK